MTYRTADLQKLEQDLIRVVQLRIAEFKQNSVAIEILPSQNKMEWLKDEETLFKSYDIFRKYDFIECDKDTYLLHFIGTEPYTKIKFKQNLNELPYIINDLQEAGVIAEAKHLHIQLSEHFVDKYGNPIGLEKLRSSLNKGIRNEKRKQFIDNCILNELLKC